MAIQFDNTNAGTITLKPAASGTYSLVFPAAVAGANGYVLTSDTSGNLTWAAASGSGTVNSGTANQIAYYSATGTAVLGLSALTWVSNTLTVGSNSSNYFTLTSAASGTGPTVASAGVSDANVNFNVQTKGTGSFVVASTTTNTTSNITASGANPNINLVLAGKGTGTVVANTLSISTTGVVTSGTWNGSVIGPAYGGTGIANNPASTLAISGNFSTTFTVGATTTLTLPANGTVTALGNTTTGSGTSIALGTSPSFATDIRTPKITTVGAVNLVLDTNTGTTTGSITINTGLNADIAVTPNGTGGVNLGDMTNSGLVTTGAVAANLTLSTNSGTNSGTVVITAGTNGNIAITPNGSGSVVVGNTSTSIVKSLDASGTDAAAAVLSLQAGANTGNNATGGISFSTSSQGTTGTVPQTITERMRIETSGGINQLDLTTSMATANLFLYNATTVNFAGTATSTKIGASGTVQLGKSASAITTVQIGGAITGNVLQLNSAASGTTTITTANTSNLVINTNSGTNAGSITLSNGINGNIAITPNGTGNINLGDTTTSGALTTGSATANLVLSTNGGTTSGSIIITAGANGNIAIAPNGTGVVNVGDTTASGILTTGSLTANLTLNTNNGTTSGSVVINAGANGNIDITPNGTGQVRIPVAAATMTMGPSTGAQNAITLNLGNSSSTTQPTSATINFRNSSVGTPANIQCTTAGISYNSNTLNNLQTFGNYTSTNTGTAMTMGGADNRVDIVNQLSAGSFVLRGAAYFNGTVQGGAYSVFDFDEITLNDGTQNQFTLTYNQTPQTVLSPYSLLVTINGLVQPAFITNYDMIWTSCFFGAYKGYTVENVTGTLSGVDITGTNGQFSCLGAPSTLYVGQPVTITGTNSNGTYANPGTIQFYSTGTVYYITSTNGSTTFTLSTALGGLPIVTAAGTPTGLTYTMPGASYIKFSGEVGLGSEVMIRNTGVPAAVPPQKRYPFKPAEIMLGT